MASWDQNPQNDRIQPKTASRDQNPQNDRILPQIASRGGQNSNESTGSAGSPREPRKHRPANMRRQRLVAFYLADKNPFRQSLIREKRMHFYT